ncbi:hypothetical protein ACS0TY_027274 [Phlomoides rotata]
MGVINHEMEVVSSIPPSRLFKAFILDGDNLVPKVVPGIHKSLEVQGDGGAGTIKSITFNDASPIKSVKHLVDEIDEVHYVYKYSVIEGDALGDALDKISYVVKFEAGPDGGSIVKTTSTYHTKKDDFHITEEMMKDGKEKVMGLFHAVEAHLHANPHEYC